MSKFNWLDDKAFNQNNRNREKLSDSVAVVEYPGSKKYGSYRFIGNPSGTAMHWLSTLAKLKEGEAKSKKPRIVSFPKLCLGYDPETNEVDASKCPYCTVLEHNPRVELRQNVIDRMLQENEPRNATPLTKKESKLVEWNGGKHHLKDGKEGGGWTPVRVLTIIPSIGSQLVEITSLNTHKVKGEKHEFGPDHHKYGFDVRVKFDKDASTPSKMYIVQKGDIAPLTDEEREYAIWALPDHKPEDEASATKEAKRIKKYLVTREGELIFPGADDDDAPKKKKKNNFKDDFDVDEDIEDDDDDEDRSSKKKSKSKSKSKWDDDDEVPFDTDDDDEDERPKKSKSKSKVKTKVKSKVKGKIKLKK